MSKITVRADDDLVERLDALDASKSQVVREALRAYLDGDVEEAAEASSETGEDADGMAAADGSLDALIAERVDELVEERLDEAFAARRVRSQPQDVNVNVTVDGAVSDESDAATSDATAEGVESASPGGVGREESAGTSCAQCGSDVGADHVYCPNCGEKATRRAFCECGDEVRSDWAFCPSCGRRTPAADVLDSG